MYGSLALAEKKNNALFAAIGAGEAARVAQAIADGADVDANDGKPLRLCAENDDYRSAKILFLKGADIDYVIRAVRKEMDSIPQKFITATLSYPQRNEDFPRFNALGQIFNRLEKYKESFLQTVLPQEQMRKMEQIIETQKRFAVRLDQIQKELDAITKPQDMGKALPNPQAPKSPKP